MVVAADFEHAGSWLDAIVKGMSVVMTALFGWVWRTNQRQAKMEQQMASGDARLRQIEKGVGRILNHLTGTELHED